MLSRDLTSSEQRLVKIIRFTQFAMLLAVMSYLLESWMNASTFFTPNVVVTTFAGLLSEFSIRFVHAKRKALAFSMFLSVVTIALFISIWNRGGLYSPGIVGVPVIILFSILYGQLRDMLCLLVTVFLYTLLLSQTARFDWLPNIGSASDVIYQLPIVMIFICIGGYISWAIGNDMRKAFKSLHEETVNLSASQESIRRLSKTDFLTGLVNAKQASLDYEALLATLTKEQVIFFYFIDLDGFKEVNDLFDHKSGDELLVLVADRLRESVDEAAHICRLSGDEFVVFLAANRNNDATDVAGKILDTIAQPHTLFGTSAQITASMGIASTHECSFSTIRKKASMAMYQSKREGMSHYYLYSDELEAQYMRRIYILKGLKNGVEDGLLELYFQPKVDLVTRQISGMEALIRWTKDNPHHYTPDEFMSVIESVDLVHDIGRWVMTEACAACKEWHKAGHKLPVAVNVSAKQLLRPDFADMVREVLSTHKLDGRFLEVELTERFFVEQNDAVEKQLADLRRVGVSLAIDDFGTGYSNVSYLMNLEANVLKLDKSFVDRLHDNASIQSVIRAIIEIARAGQMKVVVEGLETLADINAVTKLGCDEGQGYYWSKPVNQQATLELLNVEMCA